jgi:hypothetical protein
MKKYLQMISDTTIFVKNENDMAATDKRMNRGKDLIRMGFRIDRDTYERLLKLKISEGDTGSFNRYLNKILSEHTVRHEVAIKGYEVTYDDFN